MTSITNGDAIEIMRTHLEENVKPITKGKKRKDSFKFRFITYLGEFQGDAKIWYAMLFNFYDELGRLVTVLGFVRSEDSKTIFFRDDQENINVKIAYLKSLIN